MPQVPTKVAARLSAAIKRFQPIVASAKSRDANESDTVIVAVATGARCEMLDVDLNLLTR